MTIQPTTSRPLRQAGIYAIVVIASVILTLGSLRVFPQLLPSTLIAENSTAIKAVPSQAPAVSNNQPLQNNIVRSRKNLRCSL